jgi:amidase
VKHLLLAACATVPLFACSPQSVDTAAVPMEQTTEKPNYVPQGWIAKTLPEIAAGVKAGEVTSEELVQAYIDRINRVDRDGPTLQSVLSLNPNALVDARAADAKRAAGDALGLLHGVPILLKDNIETKDPLATTAGALALQDNVTGRDSPLVAGLRDAGAIILGKANLSQWANFRSNDSMSGWTALGGQVRNPHMLDRNPCGSSSGSGAGAASSMAAGAVGTETNGSVICPSNANGVVGFKPTVGLVSQQYIVPISSTQDTAGPMTKSVMGAAMMMNAMATGSAKMDYVAALDQDMLRGKRVGVLRYSTGSNKDINGLFEKSLDVLIEAGAELVEITENPIQLSEFGQYSFDVLLYEFKATLNEYLAATPDTVKTRSLAEVIAFNIENADIELPLFDQSIFEAAEITSNLEDPRYIAARDAVLKATREEGIDKLLAEHNVDVLVAPSGPIVPRVDPINGDVWPPFPGSGSMAAIAGYPHITVPMGTIHSLSVSFSFMGAKNDDAKVLSYGYAFEQLTNKRAEPQYYTNAEDLPDIAEAMRGPKRY